MASTPLTFPCTLAAPVRPGLKPPTSAAAASAGSSSSSPQAWWGPLFGYQTDPDYVGEEKPAGVRFAPGSFTEEKARALRRKTAEGKAFHDVMYHSAIASRLATDVSDRAEK